MKIISFAAGITKPSLLLVHPEMPILNTGNSKLNAVLNLWLPCNRERRIRLITKFQYSVVDRTFTSSSKCSSTSKSDSGRLSLRRGGSSSLYSRPSLTEMKKDKIANRAMVYEFLRGIGIVPDELDGLELPVTVEFLRRYPQVLHASVVVDLTPVVKYLQGMDIKPVDVPRVLERYPEVLGFKLEGTMSTSVAYLVGIGVSRREIGGVLTRYPEILGMRVGRVIKPFVEYLESLGIPRLAIARLIEQRPHILGFSLKEKVKPNVESLEEFNVRKTSLPYIIAQYPEIIGIDLKPKLLTQQSLLNSVLDMDTEDFGRVVEKMPQVVSLTSAPMVKHVDFLKECGFSLQQMRKMVVGCPQLLALNIDIMKLSFDFFEKEMKRPLDDLVTFPAFFTYGLESTVKPRHKMVAKKGLKCSLAWMLNCSDEKFEQRMEYDTIDLEEMETEQSFDMNSLMEPQIDDESASDYDYSDDDSE
ncbi:Mitochondrial transcription termination factor family protein [Quillaja saponaria]|uniref:Mitochondrial transcription termination factor family protein n=1 Tax=Quillaja saponaria TaxID=32244 RepID=A0AAD7PRF9_QUISA|nr:Mitochondrial transcription termination factor family protein [Quillaja saponaria]